MDDRCHFLLVYLTVTMNHEQIFVGTMMSFGVGHVHFLKCLRTDEKREKDFGKLCEEKEVKREENGRILVSFCNFFPFPAFTCM